MQYAKRAKFSWGINLLAGNASEAVAQVKQLERAFAHRRCRNVHLHTIELGNEADLWADGDRRPEDWTIWDCVDEQIEYFTAINKSLGNNGRKSVNVISEHRYQGTASMVARSQWPKIASGLINKEKIRGRLERFNVSVIKAEEARLEFVLGETGSLAGHGQAGVSNAAAAALWMVDYSLHAATFQPLDHIGVNITDFDPKATRHVMPLYYGFLVVADAIGPSGNTYISEISTNSSELAAYQIWEGDTPSRLVLIN
ncbi:hypothetical protein B0T10DRAFT_569731 [Thelonectria olida]|uniref:Glycoside hydrolase family 79 protein n=1 Tax=Thelonectria olida TaxID=1576542 RepID=A0A9P9AG21_9HYPO|nr:hypothetical protein B0T10DRAFT_569731 [Thelonectria olida]